MTKVEIGLGLCIILIITLIGVNVWQYIQLTDLIAEVNRLKCKVEVGVYYYPWYGEGVDTNSSWHWNTYWLHALLDCCRRAFTRMVRFE